MSDLRHLYQELILDHNKTPRNFRKIEDATSTAEGFNPLCGDKLTLFLKLEDGVIRDISFKGSGCAISTASASLMTAALKGKTAAEAEALFENFHRMLTGQPADQARLGKLAVFSGVNEFPIRVKCATLAWHTLRAALERQGKTASTE